ncbi:hypothetical protein ACA758_04405 [Mycoplasmopsis agassizii]|uniref:TMEM164 family acyltransferase n=1 Tax=Mycoplasmopsis agassizii TaxID=33922 RepID=UPI003528CB44
MNIYNFFSWAGNNTIFAGGQKILMIVLIVVALLAMVVVSFFTPYIKRKYDNYIYLQQQNAKSKSMFYFKTNWWWIIIASFLVFIFFFRILIFTNSIVNTGLPVYPRIWELVPLHWTRISMVLLIVVLFSVGKVKSSSYTYFLFLPSIATGFLALTNPDLGPRPEAYAGIEVHWGADSYVFWDYYFVHIFNVIVPWMLLILYRPKLTFKTLIYSFVVIWIYLISVFIINISLASSNETVDQIWISNYAYLAPDRYNPTLSGFAKPLTLWPYNLITYLILFTFTNWLISIIYYYIDKLFKKYYSYHQLNPEWNFISNVKKQFIKCKTWLTKTR